MRPLEWDVRFSSGVASLDDDHREFLALQNSLLEARGHGRGHRVLHEVLEQLIAWAEIHQAREEAMFGETGYPGAARHRAEHERLLAAARSLRLRHALDLERLTRAVLGLFDYWWKRHILEHDLEFGRYLAAERHGAPV
ncbi:MAG: bacteriohemerythrin [Candidatus Latescibacteria bacterium]|nr:bacteriohemerythrin [Candidatus Latescibacterota bacterium]